MSEAEDRARMYARCGDFQPDVVETLELAADRIEALEAENERLQRYLRTDELAILAKIEMLEAALRSCRKSLIEFCDGRLIAVGHSMLAEKVGSQP